MTRMTRMVLGWSVISLAWWSATSATATHQAAPVPPTQEIELLDPNVHPRGLPAVVPTRGPDGVMQIDVPPAVLVHKYYYTGDRNFQARFLPGGPTIVVANHPKTGERLYIPVQMLPGAPRVYYTCHTIEYDFGNNGITIRFCCLGKATVEYRNGPAFGSHAEKVCIKVKETATHLVERTGAKEGCQKVAEGAKNVTVTAIDHTADLAKIAITPLQQAAKLIPGINMLKSTPEDQAQRLRDAQLRAAQFQAEKQGATIQGVTIPTNR